MKIRTFVTLILNVLLTMAVLWVLLSDAPPDPVSFAAILVFLLVAVPLLNGGVAIARALRRPRR
jgi:hypothetical protein